MSLNLLRAPAARWGGLFVGLSLLFGCSGGCGQPVRENRTITFAPGGEASFQHGRNGVFITDPKSGTPKSIFQPSKDVSAVSPPRWSPDGNKLVFATASPIPGDANSPPAAAPDGSTMPESRAAGAVYRQGPSVVTIWLYDRTAAKPKAEKLCEFPIGRSGYVAADLVVRWHPRGDRLLIVRRDGSNRHGLSVYDLARKTWTEAFPHTGEDLIFDLSPDGRFLACVLGGQQSSLEDGIWVGPLHGPNWWHVPGSGELAWAELQSPLERLRATSPVWASKSERFAFITTAPGPSTDRPGPSSVRVVDPSEKTVSIWLTGPEPLRDLHWAPGGQRLGLLRGYPDAQLRLLSKDGLSAAIGDGPASDFAGWSANGQQLAYVADDPLPFQAGQPWALLLTPNSAARQSLALADAQGKNPRRVCSGLHATFPHWSPKAAKLSLWLTFEAPFQFGLGPALLRPGDPAAFVDAKTGELTWKPISAHEQAQLGNHLARQKRFADAWKWYDLAAKQRQETPPDLLLFEAHCLAHLGRAAEVRQRIQKYRDLPTAPRGPEGNPLALAVAGAANDPAAAWFEKDGFALEEFLSLDAPDAAENYLKESLRLAPDDRRRLLSGLVLCQLELLQDHRAEARSVFAVNVLPLVLKADPSPSDMLRMAVLLTSAPFASAKFLKGWNDAELRALAATMANARVRPDDSFGTMIVDLIRAALAERLGRIAEQKRTEARLTQNPARSQMLPQGLPAMLKQWRIQRTTFRKLMEMF